MKRNFILMLRALWAQDKFLCIGLDTDYEKIPKCIKSSSIKKTLIDFNREIIDATADVVLAYKPNIAFYEEHGPVGLEALQETIAYIKKYAPEVLDILDAKRADIGNTNRGYVKMAFETYGVDAITVHPYLGREAMQPFLDYKDKGIIVLCRTSNKGAGEFQDLWLANQAKMVYQIVAKQVAGKWNENGNCLLVVGATYPEELKDVRNIVGDMPILIPGIGKQGGDLEKTVAAGMDSKGQGMIINSSRGIIFASDGPDFAKRAREEAIKLSDAINVCREKAMAGVAV